MAQPVVDTRTALTASAQSAGHAVPVEGDELSLLIDVTAATGTSPTLDVAVEWSHDDGVTWAPTETADVFTQITAVSKKVKTFPIRGPMYRLNYTVGGTTPSLNFTVRHYGR